MPTFGTKLGHKKEDMEMPRFLQYSYEKGGFPTVEEIEKVIFPECLPVELVICLIPGLFVG